MTTQLGSKPTGAEQTFYDRILDATIVGAESFRPEQFIPCKGTVLVVIPPKVRKIGNIELPERAQQDQFIGRVASVPPDDMFCPVEVGEWVIFRPGAQSLVRLGGRNDLALLNYSDGMESDILGKIPLGQEPERFDSALKRG